MSTELENVEKSGNLPKTSGKIKMHKIPKVGEKSGNSVASNSFLASWKIMILKFLWEHAFP